MNEIIWPLFFLAIASQGLFLGLILMTRKKIVNGDRLYLGLFIILFSILLLFWVGFWNEFPSKYAHFNFLYTPIPLSIGPMLFFYVKSFYRKISITDFYHFIPFVLVLIYFIPFYTLYEDIKIEVLYENRLDEVLWQWNTFKFIFTYLELLYFIFYSAYIYYFIKYDSKKYDISITEYCEKWLYLINFLFGLYTLCLIPSLIFANLYELSPKIDYFNALIICLIVYVIGYIGLNHTKFVIALETNVVKKYNRSGLNSNDAPKHIESIINYIKNQRPYLSESFRIKDLSEAVNIPSHHISELLNTYHNKNFSELINYYRVEDAKQLLTLKEYDNKKVSVIGYDVGFNSRTSFYQWFKKLTGESPASYQKKHK